MSNSHRNQKRGISQSNTSSIGRERPNPNEQQFTGFPSPLEQEVLIDIEAFLNKTVTSLSFIQQHTSTYMDPHLCTESYHSYSNTSSVRLKDIISKERLELLKATGVFYLPNEANCKKYIYSYFNTFHLLYPCLHLNLNAFKSFTNPSSLLLLRVVLYIGCQVSASTAQDLQEASKLYQRANCLLSSDLEQNQLYNSFSEFALSICQQKKASMTSLNSRMIQSYKNIRRVVKDIKNLNEEDTTVFNILLWCILAKNVIYGLCFLNAHTIFDHKQFKNYPNIGDTENQNSPFYYFSKILKIHQILHSVTDLHHRKFIYFQEKLNYIHEVNNRLMSLKIEIGVSNTLYYHILKIYILSIELHVKKVEFQMIQSANIQNLNKGKFQKAKEGSTSHHWVNLVNILKEIHMSISSILMYHSHIFQYSQDILFLCLKATTEMIPFVFHKDEGVRAQFRQNLGYLIPLFEVNYRKITWQESDLYYYILTNLYPNRFKSIEFVRDYVNSVNYEKLVKKYGKLKSCRPLLVEMLPPFADPVLSFTEDFEF
ncbi:unnamed protein product [Ambrosiozyma monospora]|uniref:Unnamed protein product n=1 Tax=Ambrosiozyma monospora TaxID=43982 RepID=A0A9W7DDZ9_AMBMO|nr:unnamed protein product [Ambrosiozyma monospora]